jgi:hypothetical protein
MSIAISKIATRGNPAMRFTGATHPLTWVIHATHEQLLSTRFAKRRKRKQRIEHAEDESL